MFRFINANKDGFRNRLKRMFSRLRSNSGSLVDSHDHRHCVFDIEQLEPRMLLSVSSIGDNYNAMEDGLFVTGSTVIAQSGYTQWNYLDEMNNFNGPNGVEDYPQDLSNLEWNELDYDIITGNSAGNWKTGIGPFEAGSIVGFNGNTLLGGAVENSIGLPNTVTTYLFRSKFNLESTDYDSIALNYIVDDGAIFYLNGMELYRTENMPLGYVSSNQFSLGSGNETTYTNLVLGVPHNSLRVGENVLAVEIHQQSSLSTDAGLDFNASLVDSSQSVLANDDLSLVNGIPVVNLVGGDGTQGAILDIDGITPAGAITVRDSGVIIFSPALNYNGTATFQYNVTDLDGTSAPATVNINVAAVNDDPPAGVADNYFANEGVPIDISASSTTDIIVSGDTWDYFDQIGNSLASGGVNNLPFDGTNDWTHPNFVTANSDLGPWSLGVSPFEAGTVNGFNGLTTTLLDGIDDALTGENDSNAYVFRKVVNIANGASQTVMEISYLADDGMVLFINGTEVERFNVDDAMVLDGDATAINAIGTEDGNIAVSLDVTNLLVDGDNIFAVLLLQNNVTSSDAGFDLTASIGSEQTGVLSNDPNIDVDGDTPLTAQIVPGDPGAAQLQALGNFIFNPDGTFSFDPVNDPGFAGTVVFNYQLIDGQGGTGPATPVTIRYNLINSGPVTTNDDIFHIDVDKTTLFNNSGIGIGLGVLANDTTVAGDETDPVSIIITKDVDFGTLEINNDGSFTYLSGFSGITTFKYQVEDGFNDPALTEATVTLYVGLPNNPPILSNPISNTVAISGIPFEFIIPSNTFNDEGPYQIDITGNNGDNVNFGIENVITNMTDAAWSVYTSDLDNDGDLDVLSASRADDTIAWYENLGNSTFGGQQVISNNALDAFAVYAADLDNDGDIDVLSASEFDDKIAWYENNGFGSFSSEKIITTSADYATDVIAVDLDGDNDLDIVSSSRNDNTIAWYRNLGNGAFSNQLTISTTANSASSVYTADLDGDGDPDILSSSEFDDKVAWYENLGNGLFGGEQIITNSADAVWAVHAADLDNDGDVDVLSASIDDDKVAWYENLGGGIFGSQKIISTDADGAYDVYSEDLDNDGDMDVISASENDDMVAWYENQGGGIFSDAQVISTTADRIRSVHAADIDNDGDIDVLSASFDDDKIAWYENHFIIAEPLPAWLNYNGDNQTFSGLPTDSNIGDIKVVVSATDLSLLRTYDQFDIKVIPNTAPIINAIPNQEVNEDTPFTVAIPVDTFADPDLGDILTYSAKMSDGQPLPEWITFNPENQTFNGWADDPEVGTYQITIEAFDLGGNYVETTFSLIVNPVNDAPIVTNPVPDQTAIVGIPFEYELPADVFFDVDGDELSISPSGISNSPTLFNDQQVVDSSASGASWVHTGDLDGDSYQDIISTSFIGDKVSWYRNLGDGTFSSEITISNNVDGAATAYVIDLDGDLDLDVLSASAHGNKVAWYENDGTGIFGPENTITTSASNVRQVFSADLDGDGDNDVLSASQVSANSIAWYENDGNGGFSSPKIISNTANNGKSVHAADLNNDGLPDVISASWDDDKIAWYRNLGNGLFSTELVLTTIAGNAHSVIAKDLNLDGNIDIIFSSVGDNKIGWFENLGSNVFSAEIIISTDLEKPHNVFSEDIDGDGDFDVISSSADNDKVGWFENDGNGGFSNLNIVTMNTDRPLRAYAADLDNDGDMEILSASQNDNKIAWYENLTIQPLPAWLNFNEQSEIFTGNPSHADIGTHGIRLTATDTSGPASVSDDFTISVLPNTPPSATPISNQQATEDISFDIHILQDTFSDPDLGDVLSYSAMLQNGSLLPDFISFDENNLSLTGIGEASNIGLYELRISATDLGGNLVHSDFTLEVIEVNDPPVLSEDSYSIKGNSVLDVAIEDGVLNNDSDEEGGIVAVLDTNTSHGDLDLNPDGSFTYTPTQNYFGTDTFTYIVDDNGVLSDPVIVDIEVFPAHDFNVDAVIDASDIDQLQIAVFIWNAGLGGDVETFDLSGDHAITQDDMDILIHDILNTEYGDTNLDGKVGISDLAKLASNYNVINLGWGDGDFNGDRKVDIGDLAKLASNYGYDNSQGGAAATIDELNAKENGALQFADLSSESAIQSHSWSHIVSLLKDDEMLSIL